MTTNLDNIYVDMRPTHNGKFVPASSLPYDLAGDIDFDWIKRQMSSEDEQEDKLVPIINTVSTPSGNTIELDEDALKRIFLRPEVAKCPVMLLSVSGAFRKGKSFLLNFFLRYLRKKGYENPSWLGDSDLIDGFQWKGGKNPMTHGILIYNEPFMVKVGREDVAVLLMDTQGLFDNNSDKKLCTQIFAFSTLLSSVQVFNLSQQIQENDLEYLQCFTEYAKASQAKKIADDPIFQKLMFVVRDWQGIDDHDWGLDETTDGNNEGYLTGVLSCTSNNKELTKVREHLHKSFNDLQCFLLPHPGSKVAVTRKNQQFKGELKDIDEEFLEMVQELADILLNPKSIVTKKINGQTITGNSLVNYAITCARSFTGGSLPNPQAMLQTQEEVTNLQLLRACTEEYVAQMKKITRDRYVSDEELRSYHDTTCNSQLKSFRRSAGKINSGTSDLYGAKLMASMLEQFEIFQRTNYAKGREIARAVREKANRYVHEYVMMMEENTKDSGLEDNAFEKCHQLSLQAKLTEFQATCKGLHGFSESLEAFHMDVNFCLGVLTRINTDKRNLQQMKTKDDDVRVRNVIHECVELYKKHMKKFSRHYMDYSLLVNEHGKVRGQIFKHFEQKSKLLTDSSGPSSELSDKLQNEFCAVEAANETNQRMLGLVLQQKRNKLIVQYRVTMSKGMADAYIEPSVLEATHSSTEQNVVDRLIHDDEVLAICTSPITDTFVRKSAEQLRKDIQQIYEKLSLTNEENRKLYPQTTRGVKGFFKSIWNSKSPT